MIAIKMPMIVYNFQVVSWILLAGVDDLVVPDVVFSVMLQGDSSSSFAEPLFFGSCTCKVYIIIYATFIEFNKY